MQKRNPIAVALLPLVTFGIYQIVWYVKTKRELVAKGADIPTSWLLIVPIASIYWMWKYCQGAEQVTGGQQNAVMDFILLYVIGSIGAAIMQDGFNKLDSSPAAAAPASPVPAVGVATPAMPTDPAPMPIAPTDPTPPSTPQV